MICIAFSSLSTNTSHFLQRKEELPHYRFAAVIENSDDKSLLNYGILDFGLYTVTGTIPNTQYFMRNNFEPGWIDDVQADYIREKRVKFVLTTNVDFHFDGYDMVLQQMHEGKPYYLYQRMD